MLDLSLGKQEMFVWSVTSREDLTDIYCVITRATWAWYFISAQHTHYAASLGQLWHIWCLPLGTACLFVWWHWHWSISSAQLTGCLEKNPSVHVGAEPAGRKKGLSILPTGLLSCSVRLAVLIWEILIHLYFCALKARNTWMGKHEALEMCLVRMCWCQDQLQNCLMLKTLLLNKKVHLKKVCLYLVPGVLYDDILLI